MDEPAADMATDEEGWQYGEQVSALLAGHGVMDCGADQGRLGRPLRQLRMRRWRRHCICSRRSEMGQAVEGGAERDVEPVLAQYAKIAAAAAMLSQKTRKLMEVQNKQAEVDSEITLRRRTAEDLEGLRATVKEVEAKVQEYQAKLDAVGVPGRLFNLWGTQQRPDEPATPTSPVLKKKPPPPRTAALSLADGPFSGMDLSAPTLLSPGFQP